MYLVSCADFGRYIQGLGTGLILGSIAHSPAVMLISEVWRWCLRIWDRVQAMYVKPAVSRLGDDEFDPRCTALY